MSSIEDELERMGCDPEWRGRYWVIHCPQHQDRHKSCVCFEDGWIHCFSGCKRVHINKLARHKIVDYSHSEAPEEPEVMKDHTSTWLELEPLTEPVKGVPAKVLNKVGWRKYNESDIFIPYFNTSKTKVPFYQIRHTVGERRFSFAPGQKPITYGLDVLPGVCKYLFVTEGSRDSVILRWAGINAVALPSASSLKNIRGLQEYVKQKGILLCWCGDRDGAGEKLLSNLTIPYVDCRSSYKDIGDMLEAEGIERIKKRYESYIERPDFDLN